MNKKSYIKTVTCLFKRFPRGARDTASVTLLKRKELDEPSTAEDFSVVRQEGHQRVKRQLKHGNLDANISVGYGVSSARATQFRIWATGLMRQHLMNGYALNQRQLTGRGIEFEQAPSLLARTLANQQRSNREPA
ncbi:hypothetical protein E4T66_09000 [Sinimarinibacterium sp. CAU 1509]|nr:RhuM family protein [Sinimarinibacterium sp. CAU 1509]TJY60794.1 hypothetical protein E4T66_09000 [Sinimarinibacterium sp. CAU 1509]